MAVSLKKRNDQEPWDAMQGVLDYGDRVGKLIVAVDEDINPRDPVAVTWAITHRSSRTRISKWLAIAPSERHPSAWWRPILRAATTTANHRF